MIPNPNERTAMKYILFATLVTTLAGCGTLDGKLQNRVTTTLDCERGFLASLYGPFGITSEIDKADVVHLPCHARAPAGAKPPTTQPVR